ncbi:hypothetical protein EDB89DRAFT_1970250 [Lactarius sanguifluus]|nr:hypothetical protein EDB89DRAFT_1970250 [Lactarius sanguifluus]
MQLFGLQEPKENRLSFCITRRATTTASRVSCRRARRPCCRSARRRGRRGRGSRVVGAHLLRTTSKVLGIFLRAPGAATPCASGACSPIIRTARSRRAPNVPRPAPTPSPGCTNPPPAAAICATTIAPRGGAHRTQVGHAQHIHVDSERVHAVQLRELRHIEPVRHPRQRGRAKSKVESADVHPETRLRGLLMRGSTSRCYRRRFCPKRPDVFERAGDQVPLRATLDKTETRHVLTLLPSSPYALLVVGRIVGSEFCALLGSKIAAVTRAVAVQEKGRRLTECDW